MINWNEVFSVAIILFSVIDIIGSIPILVDLKNKGKLVHAGKATIISGLIMIAFLIFGVKILDIFSVDVESFSIAGAIILFLLGLEMILGIVLFRDDAGSESNSSTIVPVAFPLIAGAGSMTTIISLKSEYEELNILIAVIINLILVYFVLKTTLWLKKILGRGGMNVLRKVFGIILLSIAIKLFKTNIGLLH